MGFKLIISFSIAFICLNFYSLLNASEGAMSYTIDKFWDNRSIAAEDKIHLHFEYVANDATGDRDLRIKIQAPFYDDPHMNDTTPVGSMDKLWDWEVVEVFFLGSDDRYLETEFAPKGQYLLLQLHGAGNVTKYPIPLDTYSAKIHGKGWTGSAVIPGHLLPPELSKFNAFAIHGTDPERQYLALYPVPFGKFDKPNFHRLEYFQKFDLK